MRFTNEKKTEHHIIPRNAVDIIGTNDKRNKIMLPEHIHINRHRVFWNMEFHYQVLQILEWNWTVVQEKVIKAVAQIVQQDYKYIYIDWVWRPRN